MYAAEAADAADEPSLGLAPLVVDRILDAASQLAKEGTAILLVEQSVEKALARSHRAYILDAGRIVHSAPAKDLIGTDVLHKSSLGINGHNKTQAMSGTG